MVVLAGGDLSAPPPTRRPTRPPQRDPERQRPQEDASTRSPSCQSSAVAIPRFSYAQECGSLQNEAKRTISDTRLPLGPVKLLPPVSLCLPYRRCYRSKTHYTWILVRTCMQLQVEKEGERVTVLSFVYTWSFPVSRKRRMSPLDYFTRSYYFYFCICSLLLPHNVMFSFAFLFIPCLLLPSSCSCLPVYLASGGV